MVPFIQREPAAIAAAIIAVLQVLVIFNVVTLTVDQLATVNTAMVLVLGLFVRQVTTPTASPTLSAGTEVKVQNTTDSVIIEKSPPGPVGVEGGAVDDRP